MEFVLGGLEHAEELEALRFRFKACRRSSNHSALALLSLAIRVGTQDLLQTHCKHVPVETAGGF
jgi:hypothetical protein